MLAETFQAGPIHHGPVIGVRRQGLRLIAREEIQPATVTHRGVLRKLIHLPMNSVGINELSGKCHFNSPDKSADGRDAVNVPGRENVPVAKSERNALTPEATVRYTFCYRIETQGRLTIDGS